MYALFCGDFMNQYKIDNPVTLPGVNSLKLAAAKWATMNETDKKPFLLKFDEQRAIYHKNMEKYNASKNGSAVAASSPPSTSVAVLAVPAQAHVPVRAATAATDVAVLKVEASEESQATSNEQDEDNDDHRRHGSGDDAIDEKKKKRDKKKERSSKHDQNGELQSDGGKKKHKQKHRHSSDNQGTNEDNGDSL